MSKWKTISALLALVLVGLVTIAAYRTSHFPGGIRITPHNKGIQPYLLNIDDGASPSATTYFNVDNNGFVNRDNVILINDIADLSESPNLSGSSYFQMFPNKTYIVDFHAIATSGAGNVSGTSAIHTFSAITAYLPYSGATNSKTTSKVMLAWTNIATGTSSVGTFASGASELQVWPAPFSSGVTYVTGQNAAWRYPHWDLAGVSTFISNTADASGLSGVSFYSMRYPGNNSTWMTFDQAGVSAIKIGD